jgi:AraC-like DNA-binding protein
MIGLSKLFDSITVKLFSADIREVTTPIHITGLSVPVNYIVQINKGNFYNGQHREKIKEGSFYFRPVNSSIDLYVGDTDKYLTFNQESGYPSPAHQMEFHRILNPLDDLNGKENVFTSITFVALLHNSIKIFETMNLPFIPLPCDDNLNYMVRKVCIENYQNKVGQQQVLKHHLEEIIIRLLRYIISIPDYEENVHRIKNLADPRLLDIAEYVRQNLNNDLSNKQLARVCKLDEYYIGQFFKSITNINLQDFVESQRLEAALHLLTTTTNSIEEIAYDVGFRNLTYFSRRFKQRFNTSARDTRKRLLTNDPYKI